MIGTSTSAPEGTVPALSCEQRHPLGVTHQVDDRDVAAHITLIQPLFPAQAVAHDPGPRSHAPPRQQEREQAGEAYEGSGCVVVDELGRPLKTDKLRREAQKLMEEAGVRRVRLYDARHACLSWMANSGVPESRLGEACPASRPGKIIPICEKS
jgi:hypothetical protein